MYEILCKDCDKQYIGEKGRRSKKRKTEYKLVVKRGDTNNGTAVHAWEAQHHVDWEGAKVRDTEPNKAIFGGAIYVDDISNYGACTRDTECFIQVQALYMILNNTLNLESQDPNHNNITKNVFFFDNKASKSGDNIYGGLLNRCITDIYSETSYKTRAL